MAAENAQVNLEEKKKEEERIKKCVVHFRPKNEWRGGYGFDWVRLPSDPYKEVQDRQGHVSMSTLHCVGKFICPAKRVVISASKNDANVFKAMQVVTPFDMGNYNVDLEGDPVYFCQHYIKFHGMPIPVNGNNAIMYELMGGKKIVSFSRSYSVVEGEDEKGKKGGKKKNNDDTDSESKVKMKLDGLSEPPQYKRYKVKCFLDYKYTFEKGKLMELHVKELYSDREITLTSKSQLRKVSRKDKNFFKLNGDIVDDCWQNKNMTVTALSNNIKNLNVMVENEGAKTVELEEHSGNTFTLNYEDGVLVSAAVTTMQKVSKLKSQDDIKKKGRQAGLTADMINDKDMDFMSLLKSMNYKRFSITMEQPKKLAMLPISFHAEKKNGESKIVVDSFNGYDNADDNLLHDYSVDYTQDRCQKIRDPYGKFNAEPYNGIYWDVIDYYYSTLGIPYSQNKKYKGIGGQAEIQLFISGDYDEIELVPDDEKLIKLSETKIKSGENCKLTVKVKAFFNETFVKAKSDGNEVGRLKVTTNILQTVKIRFINVNIKDHIGEYKVSTGGWRPRVENTRDIMLQAGVKLEDKDSEITVEYEDIKHYFDPSKPKSVVYVDQVATTFNGPQVSLTQFLEDQLYNNNRELYNNCYDAIRVYVLDVLRVEDDDFFIYGYRWPGIPDVIVLFKKCIDSMKMDKSNVIAHELGHLMGLEHSYHNNEKFTMQNECTANVMDVSEVKYALTESQWKTVHDQALLHFATYD